MLAPSGGRACFLRVNFFGEGKQVRGGFVLGAESHFYLILARLTSPLEQLLQNLWLMDTLNNAAGK